MPVAATPRLFGLRLPCEIPDVLLRPALPVPRAGAVAALAPNTRFTPGDLLGLRVGRIILEDAIPRGVAGGAHCFPVVLLAVVLPFSAHPVEAFIREQVTGRGR